jgi:hypothetical protein
MKIEYGDKLNLEVALYGLEGWNISNTKYKINRYNFSIETEDEKTIAILTGIINENKTQRMKNDDPAYWMLKDDFNSTPSAYNLKCYICRDPEYAQMGLPLCYPCYKCGAHVPADDCICDNGHNQLEEIEGENYGK